MERWVLVEAGILWHIRRPFFHDLPSFVLFFLLNVEGVNLALGESLSSVVAALVTGSNQTDDVFSEDYDSDGAIFFVVAGSDTDVVVNGVKEGFSTLSAHQAVVN